MISHPLNASLKRSHTILAKDFYLSRIGFRENNTNTIFYGGKNSCRNKLIYANLLQANSSYVILDPDGSFCASTGAFLVSEGYNVIPVYLADVGGVNGLYNPYRYAETVTEQDKVANCLLQAGISFNAPTVCVSNT